MNRNRNQAVNQEDFYQNVGRVQPQPRIYQQRVGLPVNPNFLNPQYQNPVDLLQNYNRNGRINEPEENIYERLDNDDEEDSINDDDQRAEGLRNENPANLPVGINDPENHYERIDNRPWYRGTVNNRSNADSAANNLPNSNFWNLLEAPGYDHMRYVYAKSRLLDQSSINRLGGRNCFSTENIAAATNSRRYVYQFGHSRMCQSCTRFSFDNRDGRYACQYCNNFHERLRYYDSGNPANPLGNSRHYIYQVSRSCRCAFCRGDYNYARLPMSRFVDSFRRDCQCRNPDNCNCRGRLMSSSNSAIYIARIDRLGLVHTVNNPLYSSPTIYIGRIDRSCASGLASASSASANASNETNPVPSTSGTSNDANQRSGAAAASAECPGDQSHPQNNVTGVCQFLGRNERSEYQHGRLSFQWWFVNRWLPPWGSQNAERNQATAEQPAPRIDEPREHHESDTEESRE